MEKKDLRELRRIREEALKKIKEGKQLSEPDFSQIPEWEQIIHKVTAELTAYRLSRGITQKELAERMRVKQSLVSRFEHTGRNPSIELLDKFCSALELKLFITPFGDRTVVLTPEQKEVLEKHINKDRPDYIAVLQDAIERYSATSPKEYERRVLKKRVVGDTGLEPVTPTM